MRYRLATILSASVVVFLCVFGQPVHADRLYWAITSGDTVPGLEGSVNSVRTDGTGLVELYECTDCYVEVSSVAVGSVSRRLYWTEHSFEDSTHAIVRADGNGCQKLQTDENVFGIALDTSGGRSTGRRSKPEPEVAGSSARISISRRQSRWWTA